MTDEETPTFCYILQYHHRYGVDTWPVFQATAPTEDEVVDSLEDDFEEDLGESIEINGPFIIPPGSMKTKLQKLLAQAQELPVPTCATTPSFIEDYKLWSRGMNSLIDETYKVVEEANQVVQSHEFCGVSYDKFQRWRLDGIRSKASEVRSSLLRMVREAEDHMFPYEK